MTTTARAFFLFVLSAITLCVLAPADTSAGIKAGYILPQDGQFDPDAAFGLDGHYKIGGRWTVGFDYLATYFYPSDSLPLDDESTQMRNTIIEEAILVTASYFLTDEYYVGAGVGRYFVKVMQDSPNITEHDNDGVAAEVMVGWLYKSPNRHHWLPFIELKYLFQQGASVTYHFDTGEVKTYSQFNNLGLYIGLTF